MGKASPALESTPTAAMLSFGEFRFDPRSELLYQDQTPVNLPQLPSRALAKLLAHAGEVVSHEQLQCALWDDRVVSYEQSLHTCVRQIRKALGDDASQPRYVQTLPRRGYRFIAEVKSIAPPSTRPTGSLGPRLRALLIPGAMVALLLAIALLWLADDLPAARQPARSLAILPSLEAGDRVDSATALRLYLRERLAGAAPRQLQLIESASLRALVDQGMGLRAIAATLETDYLLLARPLADDQSGWELVLLNVDAAPLWSHGLSAADLAAGAQPDWLPALQQALDLETPLAVAPRQDWPSAQAREDYLTAVVLAESETTDPREVLAHLESTLALAPAHPAALSLKARSLFKLGLAGDAAAFVQARGAAQAALAADPDQADAWTLLAWLALMVDGDLLAARAALDHALAAPAPGSEAWQAQGALQMLEGDAQSALRSMHRALEIDPYNAILKHDLGQYYLYLGDFDKAARYCALAAEQRPQSARQHWWCVLDAALLKADTVGARAAAAKIGLPGDQAVPDAILEPSLGPFFEAWLTHLQILRSNGQDHPMAEARLLARLNRFEQAQLRAQVIVAGRLPGWRFVPIDPVLNRTR